MISKAERQFDQHRLITFFKYNKYLIDLNKHIKLLDKGQNQINKTIEKIRKEIAIVNYEIEHSNASQ